MRRAKDLWVAVVSALLGLGAAPTILAVQAPLPPGIGINMTVEGPVFVDARGMTLYVRPSVPCTGRPETLLRYQADAEGSVDLKISVPDAATRKTCAEKHPALQAPTDARPVGLWSAQRREDGTFQWAYKGELLYTSIKDKSPGEVNGTGYSPVATDGSFWALAFAPLPGAPSGITVARTAAGPALASFAGKALYYRDQTAGATDSALWNPLAAPEGATGYASRDWSVVIHSEGTRQWAYQGKPLYTFAADSDAPKDQLFADIVGDPYGVPPKGWHVALLATVPDHPAGVSVRSIVDAQDNHHLEKRVYATQSGMTLYTIQCVEDTSDLLECDDMGDSPSYWLDFCGGEQHCQETWHPLPAPADAKSIGHFWSVRVINPRHPWRAPQSQDQQRVWAYRDRVVFTYSGDPRPGTYNGWRSFSTGVIRPQPILAYEPITP